MYKYLPISENIQEMMVMLKSLPACTLVVDAMGRLMDINIPALNIFKITSIHELDGSVLRLFPSTNYLNTVIRELKRGNTVRDARILMRRKDGSEAAIEFSACMISGYRNLFLFQFFEISLLSNCDLWGLKSFTPKENSTGVEVTVPIHWAVNAKNKLMANKISDKKRMVTKGYVGIELNTCKAKFRGLTPLESVVSKFTAISMSVHEIASATNRKESTIRTIIRRIQEKQRLNLQDVENG